MRRRPTLGSRSAPAEERRVQAGLGRPGAMSPPARTLALWAQVVGGAAVGLTVLVLAGWWLRLDALWQTYVPTPLMVPNTAFGILLSGVALWVIAERPGLAGRRIACCFAAAVGLVALLTFSQYLAGWSLGIDELLLPPDSSMASARFPGRMSPHTAVGLTLLSGGLLVASGPSPHPRRLSWWLLPCAALALLALLGTLYDVTPLYGVSPETGMSTVTAVALLVLCAGLVCARPHPQLLRVLESESPSIWLSVRLVPAALVIPLLFGVVTTFGYQARLYGDGFRSALLVLSTMVGFVVFACRNLLTLADLEDTRRQADAERARLYASEQQARLEAEASVQMRDSLLALVSHDLKNPLTVIAGQTQTLSRLLQREERSSDDIAARLGRGLTRIHDASVQMTDQINELLDISALRAGHELALQRRPADLVALVREVVVARQQAHERHQIQFESAAVHLVGCWDDRRLRRVVDNLVDNAVKYSPAGGTVAVALWREERADEPWAVLAVQDHGIGIPTAEIPQLFTPFQRASNAQGRFTGTGLGLASARSIAEQHGGTVEVASAVGEGTTVVLRLPLATGIERWL